MQDGALGKVAHNLALDAVQVSILKSTGLTQSGMLGVAYLSKVSGYSIGDLIQKQQALGSWSAVSRQLGFPMDFDGSTRCSNNAGKDEDRGEESAR